MILQNAMGYLILTASLQINSVSSFSPWSPLVVQVSAFPLRKQHQQQHKQQCTVTSLSPLKTLSTHPSTLKSKIQKFKSHNTHLFASSNNNNSSSDTNKASVSLSSTITTPTAEQLNSPTAVIDYFLSILTSDIGSIIIGSIGLLLALFNRLSTVDFDSTELSASYAQSINIQSRNDLLAVFASGAVLLNGISKLDVTSVLAESVVLNGFVLNQPLFINQNNKFRENTQSGSFMDKKADLLWAMESILSSTPAKTAVLLANNNDQFVSPISSSNSWVPILMAGAVPSNFDVESFLIPKERSTPILDRFLKQDNAKESYLPTLQALPGKVEFVYLPDNAQEALLLPIQVHNQIFALVVGSNTAKSFTPRDITWCQVMAKRIGDQVE